MLKVANMSPLLCCSMGLHLYRYSGSAFVDAPFTRLTPTTIRLRSSFKCSVMVALTCTPVRRGISYATPLPASRPCLVTAVMVLSTPAIVRPNMP